jgi:hypothetical protein
VAACACTEYDGPSTTNDDDEHDDDEVSTEFEVTLPMVVTVKIGDDGIARVTSAHLERGYPGFFSDAEDARGVWDEALQVWDEEQPDVATVAWQWGQRAVRAGMVAHAEDTARAALTPFTGVCRCGATDRWSIFEGGYYRITHADVIDPRADIDAVVEGALIDQTYGAADVPDGWLAVQADDDMPATFGDDQAAALAVAEAWGTEYRYVGATDGDGDECGDWIVRIPLKLAATYQGSEDWSDGGNGDETVMCRQCGAEYITPDEVVWS